MMPDLLDPETRAFLFNEGRLQAFRDRLLESQRRIVRQDVVWSAFAESYRDSPSGPERRRWLRAVLEELSQHGEIALPVRHGKRWDRTSDISLPTAITLISFDRGAANECNWRNFPWHPRLHWVFSISALMGDQVSFLKRVHAGFVSGWFDRPECFKYRSLQLTGDEKRLEKLRRGILFGPERLTLEMLGCEPESLPLASQQLSADSTLLIFENAAPFMLARKILANSSRPTFGRMAYGAGRQVLKAVKYVPMLEPPIREILYVGDLDAEGMAIAAELQRLSTSIPVRPATDFHSAMLESAAELGSPDGWPLKEKRNRTESKRAFDFVVSELRQQITNMIRNGHRIPEEALSFAAMTRLLCAKRGESI